MKKSGIFELLKNITQKDIHRTTLKHIAEFLDAELCAIVAFKDMEVFFSESNKPIDIEPLIEKNYPILEQAAISRNLKILNETLGVSTLLIKGLNTDINAVLVAGFETDCQLQDKSEAIEIVSLFLSKSIENHILKKTLNEELLNLDIVPPVSSSKDDIRDWLLFNLNRIMSITKSKAVSFVFPIYNLYAFVSRDDSLNFVNFKKTQRVKNTLTYKMFQENLKGPVVFRHKLNPNIECLKLINKKIGIENILIVPIWLKGKLFSVIGYGYMHDYQFSIHDVNIVNLLAKRLTRFIKTTKEFSHLLNIISSSEKEIINSFILTIEMRDVYTKGHSQRVAYYARNIAKALGYKEEFQEKVYIAGLLHDIGKISIPDSVLLKPAKLSEVEYEMIKYHAVMSYEIVRQFKSIKDLKDIAKMVRQHHERCDGSGYPDGITCKEITRGARILAISDVFDALTTSRPYRKSFSKEEAIKIMMAEKGHFDERILSKSKQILLSSYKEAEKLVSGSLIPKAFDDYKRRFSNVDHLTGLLNRGALLKKLDSMIDTHTPFCIYMIDVKNMDLINIRCGSDIGDLVLIKTSELLRQTEEYGVVLISRFGGDSFVLVKVNPKNDTNKEKLERFLRLLGRRVSKTCNKDILPKRIEYTVVSAESHEAETSNELIYILRKRKKEKSERP
ncbi:HD domain-containing phosphohydrolase [Hippea sp. KM1]|uniref:HD domain-containing phosphohydrolase n=1 Tax=Hippea sp. KM1 TaxID=944481 RepID=UPI00046CD617|nr:HD domain-containing phosphohydrolase [Hippea sp. KM1]